MGVENMDENSEDVMESFIEEVICKLVGIEDKDDLYTEVCNINDFEWNVREVVIATLQVLKENMELANNLSFQKKG